MLCKSFSCTSPLRKLSWQFASCRSKMTKTLASCPNTKFILSGYSQGASLVHGIKASGAAKTSVNSILLFGDVSFAFTSTIFTNLTSPTELSFLFSPKHDFSSHNAYIVHAYVWVLNLPFLTSPPSSSHLLALNQPKITFLTSTIQPYQAYSTVGVSNLPITDGSHIFNACNSGDMVCMKHTAVGTGSSHLGYGPVVSAAAAFAKKVSGTWKFNSIVVWNRRRIRFVRLMMIVSTILSICISNLCTYTSLLPNAKDESKSFSCTCASSVYILQSLSHFQWLEYKYSLRFRRDRWEYSKIKIDRDRNYPNFDS